MFFIPSGGRILAAIVVFISAPVYVAAGVEEAENNLAQTEEQNTLIDNVHRNFSDGFSDLIGGVDGFFSDVEGAGSVNRSWMRLRLEGSKFESDDIDGRVNIKVKLVLPNTEQKVRLLVSTEEEDTRDPQSGGIGSQSTGGADDDGNLSLALRFLQSAVKDTDSVNFDIGARIRDGKAQAFGRIKAFAKIDVTSGIALNLTNNLWYFSSSGYENSLRLTYEKPLEYRKDLFFRASTRFRWLEGRKGAAIGQSLGFYRVLDKQTFLSVELLGSYRTASSIGVPEHFEAAELRFRYRKNIWRSWFYYELWPRVRWSAENGYDDVFGLLARIEVVVGKRKARKN